MTHETNLRASCDTRAAVDRSCSESLLSQWLNRYTNITMEIVIGLRYP
jgi:hypothetical protein